MIKYLIDGTLPENKRKAAKIAWSATQFVMIDDILCFIGNNPDEKPKLVIPETLKEEILEACHEDVFSGHFGFARTYAKIRLNYFWPSLYNVVKIHCDNCIECITKKNPRTKAKAFMTPIPVTGPFDRVAVDVMGPLPMLEEGNIYIIVFSEYLTKCCIAKAILNMTAETPKILLSDKGTNFYQI